MRVFEKPNRSFGWKCPICKTSDEKEVFLASKYGTQDGSIVEGEQIHTDCLDLWFYPDQNVLAMRWQ